MRFYDPLELVGPVITESKIFLEQLSPSLVLFPNAENKIHGFCDANIHRMQRTSSFALFKVEGSL